MWPQVRRYQLEAEEVFPNYGETVSQMIIPNLSAKVKALLVTPKRNITAAAKQLVDSIIMKRKVNGPSHFLLSLKDLLHFVGNSTVEMLEIKSLIKKSMKNGKHTVQPTNLINALVGKSKPTRNTKTVIRILTEIKEVMSKVGKKFQARLSVEEFTQLLQKLYTPKLLLKVNPPKAPPPPKATKPKLLKVQPPRLPSVNTSKPKKETQKKSQKKHLNLCEE